MGCGASKEATRVMVTDAEQPKNQLKKPAGTCIRASCTVYVIHVPCTMCRREALSICICIVPCILYLVSNPTILLYIISYIDSPTPLLPKEHEYDIKLADGSKGGSKEADAYAQRRFSSGGESSDTDSDITERRKSVTTLEVFDLCSIRSTVHADGNLTGRVVRMETPFGKPIEEIYIGVHTGEILGSGVSGIVRLVTHKATGVKYAVKCLDLGLIKSAEGLQQLREEIYIMCQLDHPNIVRLEEVYESISEIYLVLELCLGGDLFDRLDEQLDYHYTEAQCARLVKQMLSSVRYLHIKSIIHRDLKLENFLFSTTESDSVLKMIGELIQSNVYICIGIGIHYQVCTLVVHSILTFLYFRLWSVQAFLFWRDYDPGCRHPLHCCP